MKVMVRGFTLPKGVALKSNDWLFFVTSASKCIKCTFINYQNEPVYFFCLPSSDLPHPPNLIPHFVSLRPPPPPPPQQLLSMNPLKFFLLILWAQLTPDLINEPFILSSQIRLVALCGAGWHWSCVSPLLTLNFHKYYSLTTKSYAWCYSSEWVRRT